MRDLSISVYFARAVLKNAVAQGLDPIRFPFVVQGQLEVNPARDDQLEVMEVAAFERAHAEGRHLDAVAEDQHVGVIHRNVLEEKSTGQPPE